MSLIPLRVKATAQREPAKRFCTFISGDETTLISFGMLYDAGCAYAREYLRLGIKPGDIVLIILQHTPHAYYSFLGATLMGAIPSFMPFPTSKQRPDLYWSDMQALFVRLHPTLVVSYPANIAAAVRTLTDMHVVFLEADDDILNTSAEAACVEYDGLRADAEAIFCLQHSSGTTGLKKGVMLSHRVVLDHIAAYCSAIAFSESDSIVSWLPLYHDMGFIACFVLSIVRGSHLIALDSFEWAARPKRLFDAIRDHRPTLCWLPNFAFAHLVRSTRPEDAFDLHSIRAFINCSEPCKPATFDRFVDRFAQSGIDRSKLGVCYAMAENVFAVTQTQLGSALPALVIDAESLANGDIRPTRSGRRAQALSACGKLLDGVALRICDAAGADCPPHRVGEIHVSGSSLFAGYYEQPDLTLSRKRNGWYATGDLGFVESGQLYITGRVDDMLIVNGRNYYAHDIELLLADITGIVPGRVAVVDAFDSQSDAAGIAVLAEFGADASDVESIARAIRRAVMEAAGIAIGRVVAIPAGSLIKTTSGKIDRIKNKRLYLERDVSPSAVNA